MLTLIAPIYSKNIHKYFLNSISEQKRHTFELIIFTNDFSINFARQIEEIEKNKNIKLQVIFTTRKIGFNEVILDSSQIANGSHAMILNPNEVIAKDFIKKLNSVVEKKSDVDIFEFKTSFKGFENWTPKKRLELKSNHIFQIQDFPKIIAFALPFISNKLFKISLLNSISKKVSYIETSSHLSLEIIYMLFLYAKTFIYVDEIFCNIVIWKEDLPNYQNFYKELKNLRNEYILKNKYIQEIEYASAFYQEMIIPLLYTHKKLRNILLRSGINKTLENKIYSKNSKIRSQEFNSFNHTNKYMMLTSEEAKYLDKLHPPNKWHQIMKILKE